MTGTPTTVYLLWDNTPMEKGDRPILEGVFASEEAAQAHAEQHFDEEDDWGIESEPVQ